MAASLLAARLLQQAIRLRELPQDLGGHPDQFEARDFRLGAAGPELKGSDLFLEVL
jgi:topoisomerase IA-like protein